MKGIKTMSKAKKKTVAVYIRVSTYDQAKGMLSQEKALKDYCDNHGFKNIVWYKDRISGSKIDRSGFNKLQKAIFAGKIKTVICWKLDRLSRSLKDGIATLCKWLEQDIRIVSIMQQLDFAGVTGKLIASVLFAVAEMERDNLRENIKRGLVAAKARGVKLGKRPKLFSKAIIPLIKKGYTVAEVSKELKKTRQAIYNCLKRENIVLADIISH